MQDISRNQAPYKNLTGTGITFIGEPSYTQHGWYTKAKHPDIEKEIFLLWKEGRKPAITDFSKDLYYCEERHEGLPVYSCAA